MDKYYKSGEQIQGYSIIKIVGEGRYGIAYLAQSDDSHKVIIKQLKKKMLHSTRKKLFYEEALLRELNAPYFPTFIQKFRDIYSEGYILEYIEGRVFEDLIAVDQHQFTKDEIYKVGFQILDLIEILQKNNIVHRDIRLPNIIVTPNQDLVLIDFGLARYIDGRDYVEEADYWYLGDLLIHLYYTSYYLNPGEKEYPWYKELSLTYEEKVFLQRLLGLRETYVDIDTIRRDLSALQHANVTKN